MNTLKQVVLALATLVTLAANLLARKPPQLVVFFAHPQAAQLATPGFICIPSPDNPCPPPPPPLPKPNYTRGAAWANSHATQAWVTSNNTALAAIVPVLNKAQSQITLGDAKALFGAYTTWGKFMHSQGYFLSSVRANALPNAPTSQRQLLYRPPCSSCQVDASGTTLESFSAAHGLLNPRQKYELLDTMWEDTAIGGGYGDEGGGMYWLINDGYDSADWADQGDTWLDVFTGINGDMQNISIPPSTLLSNLGSTLNSINDSYLNCSNLNVYSYVAEGAAAYGAGLSAVAWAGAMFKVGGTYAVLGTVGSAAISYGVYKGIEAVKSAKGCNGEEVRSPLAPALLPGRP